MGGIHIGAKIEAEWGAVAAMTLDPVEWNVVPSPPYYQTGNG